VPFVLLGDNHDKMVKAAARIQAIPFRMMSHSLPSTRLFLVKPLALPFDYSAFKVPQLNYHHPAYIVQQQKARAKEGVAGKYLKLQLTGTYDGEYIADDVAGILSLDDMEDNGALWLGIHHAAHINQQYMNR
jgi:hypothetical protein